MWKEVHPGIFVGKFLRADQCTGWRRDVAAAQARPHDAPNSMNKYGVVLPYSRAINDCMIMVQLVAAEFYPDLNRLKKRPYAFAVDYSMSTQRSLAAHSDSSDVTLNVCLTPGSKFSGGDLVFGEGRKRFVIKHKVGQAIIHRGSHEHRAMPLTSGRRTNLILWCAQKGSIR